MLKDVGRLATSPKRLLSKRELANQYLGAKFGWLPLIQDVKDLIDLGSSIQKRKEELHRLYGRGGLKRRIRLGVWSQVDSFLNQPLATTAYYTHYANASVHTEITRWGTVRWLPNVLPDYNPSDHDILNQARAIISGMTYPGLVSGAWDLIPWTWMLDWFANVKEFAIANLNAIPVTHQGANIMTHRVQTRQWTTTILSDGLYGGGCTDTLEIKERFVGSGSLSAHLPYIGQDRLKILGALFVQRFKH